MKKTMSSLAFAALLGAAMPGCGGTGANTNVGENADAQKMADYEAAQKASEEAMNESMKATPPSN